MMWMRQQSRRNSTVGSADPRVLRGRVHPWIRAAIFGHMILVICLGMSAHAATDVTIHPLQRHTNEFSGREITRGFRVESSKPLVGRFVWRLSAQQHTLARGEQVVRVEARSADVSIRFRVDSLRDEVVLPITLTVAVIVQQEELAQEQFRLWFFAENPFGSRGKWLESLDIQLYDPTGKTEKVFNAAAIPFKPVHNLAQIRGMDRRTLVIGSQISLRDYRGLAEATLTAATRGTRVLWLTPAEGSYPMDILQLASDLTFSGADIIRRLDKRFDSTSWSGEKKLLASQLKIHASGQQLTAEVGDEGWPWMEARWSKTNGQFVFCGFSIVDCWDDSPTPRYLLLQLLERLHAEESSP